MAKKSNKKLRQEVELSLPYETQHVLKRSRYRDERRDISKGWEAKLLRDLKKSQ